MHPLHILRTTLFEKLGHEAITAVVNDWFNQILSDPRVNFFYEDKDLNGIRRHVVYLVEFLLGSGKEYTGNSLRMVHAPLNIQSEHVEILFQLLDNSMKKYNLDIKDRAAILAVLRSLKPFIISQ